MLRELKPPGQATVIIIIIVGLQYFAAHRLFGEYPASGVDAETTRSGNNQHHHHHRVAVFCGKLSVW
jgi:hypothetical protein